MHFENVANQREPGSWKLKEDKNMRREKKSWKSEPASWNPSREIDAVTYFSRRMLTLPVLNLFEQHPPVLKWKKQESATFDFSLPNVPLLKQREWTSVFFSAYLYNSEEKELPDRPFHNSHFFTT